MLQYQRIEEEKIKQVINASKEPIYSFAIDYPKGLEGSNQTNQYSRLTDWLNSPIGKGTDPCVSKYAIRGEISPITSDLSINVLIHADQWYQQGKYNVKEGKFEVLYIFMKIVHQLLLDFKF